MARALTILASTALFAKVLAEEACNNANVEEASLLQASALKNAEVKSHTSTACAHLLGYEIKLAERKKKAEKCLSGVLAGEEYCTPGESVQCPGSDVMCSYKDGKPCCPNPCAGHEGFPAEATFPCPSNPDDGSEDGTCEGKEKKSNCLDPCVPTPPPTAPTPPSPTPPGPTPPPTEKWVCKKGDWNFPGYKATAGMACSSGATCYGEDISSCASQSTCYATKSIGLCKSGANCCAQNLIETCQSGAQCFAHTIKKCKGDGTQCVERSNWGTDDA